MDPVAIRSMNIYSVHIDAITKIADGRKVWKEEVNECLINFRICMRHNWTIIPTNTQSVEQWVKGSNKCTYTGKYDIFIIMVALYRSSSEFQCKHGANK